MILSYVWIIKTSNGPRRGAIISTENRPFSVSWEILP